MPDENQDERRWIVEPPPGPGEVSLYLACGEGVDLTEEQEVALAALLRSLELIDQEVTGHMDCSPQSSCHPLSCPKVKCSLGCHPLNITGGVTSAGSWDLMGTFVAST